MACAECTVTEVSSSLDLAWEGKNPSLDWQALHITHLAAIFSTVGASKVFSVDRCLHGNAQREKFGSRGRHSSDLELQKDTVRIEYILNTLIFNEYNIYISLL